MKVADITSEAPGEVAMAGALGVRMRVLISGADGAPGFTMRLFEVAPGGHTVRHHHPYEHEVIVHRGQGTLWSANGEHPLAPGMVVLVLPDEEHQFQAGPEGLDFFCMVPHHGHARPAVSSPADGCGP